MVAVVHGHVQYGHCKRTVHAQRHVAPDDPARTSVGQQKEETEALLRTSIRDVADPDLPRTIDREPYDQVRIDRPGIPIYCDTYLT